MEADAPQTAEGSQEMDTGAGAADEAYIGMFLLKYVCPVEECGGTMLPHPLEIWSLQMAPPASSATCVGCSGLKSNSWLLCKSSDLSNGMAMQHVCPTCHYQRSM